MTRSGRFCPYCGYRHDRPGHSSHLELPSYHRKRRKLLTTSRCGLFHHELLVHMFGFRYCPECGELLSEPKARPEPA